MNQKIKNMIANRNDLIERKFIATSETLKGKIEFSMDYGRINDNPYDKPVGGFWGSNPSTYPEYASNWHEWCDYEKCFLDKIKYVTEFYLKPDAKTLIINDLNDLNNLGTEFPSASKNTLHRRLNFEFGLPADNRNYVDWSQVSKNFDAVIVDCYINGWDTPSMVVFNPDVIKIARQCSLEDYLANKNIEIQPFFIDKDEQSFPFHLNQIVKEFEVHPDNSYYTSVDGVLFTKDMKTLIKFPPDKDITNYIIPEGVEEIDDYAFKNCQNLEKITLSKNLTEFNQRAFSQCENLKEVYLSENIEKIRIHGMGTYASIEKFEVHPNNPHFTSVDGVLFTKDMKTLVNFPFYKDTTNYTIPESVEKIAPYAFYRCKELENILLPDNLKEIGNSAFDRCTNLKEIIIPNSVEKIEQYAFNGCDKLEKAVLSENIKELKEYAFAKCYSLKEITIPEGVEIIHTGVFRDCRNLERIVIPDSVKEIDWDVFTDCNKVRPIVIPPHLEDWAKNETQYNFEVKFQINITEKHINAAIESIKENIENKIENITENIPECLQKHADVREAVMDYLSLKDEEYKDLMSTADNDEFYEKVKLYSLCEEIENIEQNEVEM